MRLFCEGGGPRPGHGELKHSSSGLLAIDFVKQVKSICANYFDEKDAKVACRELYHDSRVIHLETNVQCDYEDFWVIFNAK